MGKVIKIKTDDAYSYKIEELEEFLEAIDCQLFDYMVELATLGCWKKWSETQPEGAKFNFDDEMFEGIGDDNVYFLKELRAKIVETHSVLNDTPRLVSSEPTMEVEELSFDESEDIINANFEVDFTSCNDD